MMRIRLICILFILFHNSYAFSELPDYIHGFFECAYGQRTTNDSYEDDASIAEVRLQLDYFKTFSNLDLKIRSDFLNDDLMDNSDVNLEEGTGWIDLREFNIMIYPHSFIDMKIGRQIITWGTGDLIFINDLFPKDWQSFFSGRDDEYLKAPSDALRISVFSDFVNCDFIYVPKFDSDRYIKGERISYFNSSLSQISGQNAVIKTILPDDWGSDSELALRMNKDLHGIEAALYFYDGFFKSPQGQDPLTGKATFPELNVYGASVRGAILKGIGSVEFGYYKSKDDNSGENPFVKNSEFRFLVGYEQEISTDFNGAVQYYLEWMQDYDEYKSSLFGGINPADEKRHVFTFRLTKLLMKQNLTLSYFMFLSPSDGDWYMRPKIKYKFSDHITGEMGGNIFGGDEIYTFFGQFDNNDNMYCRIRYGF